MRRNPRWWTGSRLRGPASTGRRGAHHGSLKACTTHRGIQPLAWLRLSASGKPDAVLSFRRETMDDRSRRGDETLREPGRRGQLSFEVDRGEVVGFLGPNGAGKSTTMKMLTGTLQPDEGQVLFEGASIADDLTAAKRRVGYLPEANPLYDEMLVAEYLEYVADLRELTGAGLSLGGGRRRGRDRHLQRLLPPRRGVLEGLQAAHRAGRGDPAPAGDPHPRRAHGGPRSRTSVSRSAGSSATWVGSAPCSSSTHVMQEVEATCSRLLILRRGRLAAEGNVQDLLANRSGAGRYVVEAQGDGRRRRSGRLARGGLAHRRARGRPGAREPAGASGGRAAARPSSRWPATRGGRSGSCTARRRPWSSSSATSRRRRPGRPTRGGRAPSRRGRR